MAFSKTYHEASDADDEYERGMLSPALLPDSDTSPNDSDPPSAEHTPTTYGYHPDDRMPHRIITEWTAEECADYVSRLGLPQYADAFLDNAIVGDALVALKHDELKEMGMTSVGHRLTVLKNVYDIKIKQDIPLEPEHYVPLSAETDMQDATATQADIARIIDSIRLRDERIIKAEAELIKITEEYRKLREELLPIFSQAKGPLPPHPGSNGDLHGHDQVGVTPLQLAQDKLGAGLSRKFSTKKLWLGNTPKNGSPTHPPPAMQDSKSNFESSSLNPSAAASAASAHLTTTMMGGQQLSPGQTPNIPSPTSPPHRQGNALAGQSYAGSINTTTPPSNHSTFTSNDTASYGTSATTPVDRDPPNSGGSGGAPSVEIFKSFRVSMEDPCHRVLPAALKKYNINADWKQYALYIVYGDEERCLELDEKPLILFKQLDREGRKPMFMLRKTAPSTDPQHPASAGSNSSFSAAQDSRLGNGRAAGYQSGVQLLPGGVL